ncbi:hypothetical protein Q7P37_006210 [Cladosporium fusiforme]
MLELVILPTTTSAISATDNTFDDVSARLRSTIHGLTRPPPKFSAPTSMLPSSTEERQLPLADFESSFAKDVLELSDGDTEDALGERLSALAQELGLHAEALSLSKDTTATAKAASTNTVASSAYPVRRSESIGSRTSRSTGLTSNFSDLSRDPAHLRGKPRASLSFRDYDSFLSRGSLSERRDSLSFTPPLTPSHSSLSLALSSPPDASPRKHFRKLRGLSMLKLNKSGSSTSLPLDACPHCPQNAFSQRRAIHKLPCGHRLCTQALRNTIIAGTQSPLGSIPSCCGIPIPGRLVEQMMTRQEQSALLDKLEQWDEAASAVSTDISTRSGVANDHDHHHHDESDQQPTSHTSSHASLPRSKAHDLETILPLPGFPAHRTAQESQRNRFLTWSSRLRTTLAAHRRTTRQALQTRHADTLSALHDTHAHSLAEAEDKQVAAEADLRATHAREDRDVATALRHMEAYCAGTLGCGTPHGRTVTEQDLRELEKTQRARAGMAARHEGAIRVLRGEQGRRMKGRVARQEREMANLARAHRGEEEGMERGWGVLEALVGVKREALVRRWEVEDAVFLRRLEVETGVELGGRLPPVLWEGGVFVALAGEGVDGKLDGCQDLAADPVVVDGLRLQDGFGPASRARVDSRLD